jgi:hypothetical protein
MNFKEIVGKLENFCKTINKAIIGLAIFEGIVVIFIGIVSNTLTTDNPEINKYSTYSLIFLGVLYLFLLFIRTAYSASFPGSITNELKSERELQELKRDAERQKTITEFFVETMQRLNGQTCALNLGDGTHLCDIGISKGINELIEPVIENTYFLLDTVNTKFTIGVFLNDYRSMTIDNDWERGIIIIDDKLNKSSFLTKELFDTNLVKAEQLELQSAIRQCFNNSEFVEKNYNNGQNDFTVVCSPMPLACNEHDGLGVLFIISKKLETIPKDLPTKLKIFGRVIANWIYRYNECINNRQQLRH